MCSAISKILLLIIAFELTIQGLYADDDRSRDNQLVSIALFDLDATPPLGTLLAYESMINSSDQSLRARGIVILGNDLPVVLCAIDWIGIANESHVFFRNILAKAAGTTPDRVALHTLHQHDAPRSDFSVEKLLVDANLEPGGYEGSFDRMFMNKLLVAVKESLNSPISITHIGLGKSNVEKVASNRRVLGPDSLVRANRFSACGNRNLRAEPEGLIDPEVSLVSFWDNDKPVAVLSYYATHPQSYYRTGIANPDFPGIARFFRQLEVPDALHIHFNGAGGNIAAGKYNDGSKENRMILANRLADGMRKAWESTRKEELNKSMIKWSVLPVRLPPSMKSVEEVAKWENNKDKQLLKTIAPRVAYTQRYNNGGEINLSCLEIGRARVLGLPGECFVEFQLYAKQIRPDLFVAVAAYGDYGPGYIPPRIEYKKGGYEVEVSVVSPMAGDILMQSIKRLLTDKN